MIGSRDINWETSGAHTSVLCTVPSNHALTHAYSQWIRES